MPKGKIEVNCLRHAICRLHISICAGVNTKSLPFNPLELEWYFVFVVLDRIIALKLIHAICAFDIARGSHIFLFLSLHCACKITLLLACAVLYVALIGSWGN